MLNAAGLALALKGARIQHSLSSYIDVVFALLGFVQLEWMTIALILFAWLEWMSAIAPEGKGTG